MPELSDDELGIPEGLDPNIRAELRKSRELARDLQAANERAEALAREAAFAKAGVPDSPLAAALAKTYDGDNDPASVKAYTAVALAEGMMKYGSWNWRAETLTAMRTAGSPSRRHAAAWAQAVSSTHRPIGSISPVASATEMNSIGGTMPRTG